MAYFAKITNGIVESVIRVENSELLDQNNVEQESLGLAFIASLGLDGEWVQTSFNSTFRKKYANPEDTYDAINDVFISPKPFHSWVLDENFDWQAPVAHPTDNRKYWWDEATLNWVPQTEE